MDSIPGDSNSQMKDLPNSIKELYSEGSQLSFPFFEPARKAFEQPEITALRQRLSRHMKTF